MQRGFELLKTRKYSEAREAWHIVLDEYSMFTDAYINIANSYVKENNKQSAIEFYELAKQNLIQHTFYTMSEKQGILKDIEESIKNLQK